ncbi:MAG: hypothetical protein ACJ72D_20210 [Marmoricola sp.]
MGTVPDHRTTAAAGRTFAFETGSPGIVGLVAALGLSVVRRTVLR